MPRRLPLPQLTSTDPRRVRGLIVCAALATLTLAPACVDDREELDDDLGETHSSLTTANGISMNGLGTNGIGVNGITLNGISLNGIHLNGMSLNGIHLNGIHLNGIHLNGIRLNGIHLNGIHLNGIHLNGIHLNGIHLNGIHLNGIHLNGLVMSSLDAASQATIEKGLNYLGKCALSTSQSMTYVTLTGASQTVTGVYGLDPTWRDNAPNLAKSDVVATCVQNLAIAAGDTVVIQLTDLENFKQVLRYLVECALPGGRSITYNDELERVVTLAGGLGLAPEWETGAPTAAGQRYVSACLAARTNAAGQTVRLSLRAPAMAVASDTERASYTWNEGAFWGDLFSDTPSIKTCVGQGNGVAGRLCTVDGTCGFTSVGQCSKTTVCAVQSATDGAYTRCGGVSSPLTEEVVTTYLPIGTTASFGSQSTCVRSGTGAIVCHGANSFGEIGDGTTTWHMIKPTLTKLPANDYVEVASTELGSCSRTAQGSVYCWGQSALLPWLVASAGSSVSQLSGSSLGVCMLRANGTVGCQPVVVGSWGSFVEHPELGASVVRITGSKHYCVIKDNGDLYCWGQNENGQLGDGTTTYRSMAVKILSNVTDVATGMSSTYARTADGTLWSWGSNASGELGNGTYFGSTRPTKVALSASLRPALRGLSAGSGWACALTDRGTVWCWGSNSYGQLGDGTIGWTPTRATPTEVQGLPARAVDLSSGRNHICAQLADRRMYCWGSNGYGQLGDGTVQTSGKAKESTLVSLKPPACGNGTCSPGENTASCPMDCGTRIGDFACNGLETPTTAPTDCKIAGDGRCTGSEDCGNQPTDCGRCL
ncbi:MAG: Alpha-tubulin suppressor and related protein-like protein [Deltaproteobacteria bacterium]|nr:Alpha-tubulin suppressor and related protein-like protein [Deltaproteobacteria bacterium]